MKLYPTPSGYLTIYAKPLFEGACEECLGDGSYIHLLAGRVACLEYDGWGNEERRTTEVADGMSFMTRSRGTQEKLADAKVQLTKTLLVETE